MPHYPSLRNHLSLAIIATLTLQAASVSLPRMAHAEEIATPARALLVSSLSWATNGLAMAGELLEVVSRSGETVTIAPDSTEKPSMLCFPIEAAPIPTVLPAPVPAETPIATSTEPAPEQTGQNNPAPAPAPTSTPTPPPVPLSYSLNEAVSNPTSGKEWIELAVTPSNVTKTDRALELWDAAGRIAQIPAETDVVAGHLVVMLPSAKLNNGGDELSLRTPDGLTLGHTIIPSLEKGESWARNAAGSWAVTNDLTPGAQNRFPAPPPEEPADDTSPDEPQDESVDEPTTSTSTNNTAPTAEPIAFATPVGPHLPAFLSEAMSRPSDGPEWVELYIPTSATTILGRELQLWDAAGRIAMIGSDTPVPATGYVLITLTSAKLNNGGDDLSLRAPDGVVLDSTTIPAVDEGSSWARTDDGQWMASSAPTPGATNALPSVAGVSSTATPTVGAATVKSSSTSSSSKSNTVDIDLDLMDMPTETFVNQRVRLVGTVGSVPNLLGSTHAFVLLGEDGRAAIAYLPKHLNVPPIGATIRVMGTLTATVKQLELRMKTTDVWMTLSTSTPPTPRTVDFLAPGAEDSWSLTQARGTVTKTAASSFTLDVNGVDLTVSVPSAVGYRVSRLDKGDVVHVTGLIDPRKSSATLLPRTASDIELIEHAADSVAAPTHGTGKAGFPDWIPFGAAVGAVVSTSVAKHAYSFFKKKRLERLVIPATAALTH